MEARVIGLRGSGKTTLIEALAEGREVGPITSVKVVDSRVRTLSEIFKPKKTTFAEIRLREPEWPRAEGRRNEMARYLDALQGAQVFLHVVRAFDNPALGVAADPSRDLAELDGELLLSDLVAIERTFERARKQPLDDLTKRSLTRCKEALEAERPIRSLALDESERHAIRGYAFRTDVPQLLLLNTGGTDGSVAAAAIGNAALDRHVLALPFTEAREVAALSHEEQMEFAEALGLPGPPVEVVTRAVFEQMGLVSFFTVGDDEVRAWPIPRGENARGAAGVIHSDLARGFIRAETVSYEEFLAAGSIKACRDAGTLRLEGKEYVVADGDILNIRFNV
jgi:ribosome-binding ATPase YchF (GTP1/OBG family)